MDSATIKATVDITLDRDSRTRQAEQAQYRNPPSTMENSLIGSCSTSIDINCENITSKILEAAAIFYDADDYKKALEDNDICKAINLLTNVPLTITYYLVYVTNIPENGLISDPTDSESIGGGRIEITPHKPESPSKYGGRTEPSEKFCDPCFYHFLANPLSYDLPSPEKEQFAQLENGKSIDVGFPWERGGFGFAMGGTGKLLDINGKNLPGLDSSKVGKGEFGEEILIAKYEGINQWLYTKYYGGTQYDLITLPEKADVRYIGLNLGAAFTVTVDIKTKPREGTGTNYSGLNAYEYKFPIITISAAGVMKFSVTQPNLVYFKVTGGAEEIKNVIKEVLADRKGGDKNYLDNLKDSLTFTDKSGDVFLSQTTPGFKTGSRTPFPKRPNVTLEMNDETGRPKTFKRKAEIKETIELNCCPIQIVPESKNYSITLVKNIESSGIFDSLQVSVAAIQKAQAGAYDEKAAKEVASMDKSILCCSECYYCIFSLCDNLGEVLKRIREAERVIRNQEPKNKRSREEALKGRPQCVAYDKHTGHPVPEPFVKRE